MLLNWRTAAVNFTMRMVISQKRRGWIAVMRVRPASGHQAFPDECPSISLRPSCRSCGRIGGRLQLPTSQAPAWFFRHHIVGPMIAMTSLTQTGDARARGLRRSTRSWPQHWGAPPLSPKPRASGSSSPPGNAIMLTAVGTSGAGCLSSSFDQGFAETHRRRT